MCSNHTNHYQGVPACCPILPLWMFPSPSPTPSACGWRPTAGRTGARPWPRAATCRARAVLLLRWMVAGTALTTLARDSKVSRATAYRYPLRGPGRDRRPGPGPSRGPGSAAPVGRAERRPGRDPDPHRPGGPGATRTRAATCGTQVLAGAFGGNVQVVMDFRRAPRVHGSGGARLHPRPDRGQTPRATGPVPVGPVGDAGPGGQGLPGGRDRHPRAHEEPLPDPGRADPQQPAVRHAGPGREGQ